MLDPVLPSKIHALLAEHQCLMGQIGEAERRIEALRESAALIRGKMYVEQERARRAQLRKKAVPA